MIEGDKKEGMEGMVALLLHRMEYLGNNVYTTSCMDDICHFRYDLPRLSRGVHVGCTAIERLNLNQDVAMIE